MKSECSEPERISQQTTCRDPKLPCRCTRAEERLAEERQRLRTEELVAIRDTIKLLNDDHGLELFKKLCQTQLIQLWNSRRGVDLKARVLINFSPGSARVNFDDTDPPSQMRRFLSKSSPCARRRFGCWNEHNIDCDNEKTKLLDSIIRRAGNDVKLGHQESTRATEERSDPVAAHINANMFGEEHGIHIICLAVRFRVATRSSTLADGLAKMQAAGNSMLVTRWYGRINVASLHGVTHDESKSPSTQNASLSDHFALRFRTATRFFSCKYNACINSFRARKYTSKLRRSFLSSAA